MPVSEKGGDGDDSALHCRMYLSSSIEKKKVEGDCTLLSSWHGRCGGWSHQSSFFCHSADCACVSWPREDKREGEIPDSKTHNNCNGDTIAILRAPMARVSDLQI